MPTPRPQGIIFDLDGTLLDTLEDLADAMNMVLASHGWPTHPLDAYRRFVGNGLAMLVRRAVPKTERHDDRWLDAITEEMRTVYGRRWANKTRLYPGIDLLLRTLRAQEFPMAVLTNKPHDAAMALVDHFFSKDMFQLVTGAHPDKPRKPDPTTALETADHLGVLPASTLFLGDSDVDMQTATAAGMTPLGAGWGFRSPDELLASGASTILYNPVELLDRLPPESPPHTP